MVMLVVNVIGVMCIRNCPEPIIFSFWSNAK